MSQTNNFPTWRLAMLVVPLLTFSVDAFTATTVGYIYDKHKHKQKFLPFSSLQMVRNIDYPEALVFYDNSCDKDSILFQDNNNNNNEANLKDGLADLLKECKDVSTPALLITTQTEPTKYYPPHFLNYFQVIFRQVPCPTNTITNTNTNTNNINPWIVKSLWDAIHAVIIQPDGFGGSSGFGRQQADPERSPLPQRVVVFCNDIPVCRAARAAGMRVLCFSANDDNLADAIVDDYQQLYLQEIATPGSFWLNPPRPRDDDGNKVDVWDLIMAAETTTTTTTSGRDNSDNPDTTKSSSLTEDERLRAILDDMDPL